MLMFLKCRRSKRRLVLAVMAARHGLAQLVSMGAGAPRGVGLGVEIVAGALGYLLGALAFARTTAADFIGLVRTSLRRS